MPRDRERQDEINYLTPVLVVICIVAALVLWYVLQMPRDKTEKQIQLKEEPKSAVVIEAPEIKYPVPETPATPEVEPAPEQITEPAEPVSEPEPALPPEPEPTLEEQINSLFDWQKYGELFLREALINNFVVTIDNMTEAKLPQKFSFTSPPTGKFLIEIDANENKFMDPRNFDRYNKYVEFAGSVDIGKFVDFYVRHYALFQNAYQDLGYPDRYFNDRFVEVVDHLLVTPSVQGPLQLEQPKYYYTMVDENLESLTAGQKILIRIGPENAQKIKARLAELRKALTTLRNSSQ